MSGNTTLDYHVALLSGDEWILVAEDGSGSWATRDPAVDTVLLVTGTAAARTNVAN